LREQAAASLCAAFSDWRDWLAASCALRAPPDRPLASFAPFEICRGLARGHTLAIDVGEEPALVRNVALLGFLCVEVRGA
jgi:hypothetical protein